jgi:hypothetical protein
VQGFIDRGRENLDTCRQSQQCRILKRFDGTHEQDQKGRGERGKHQFQRHPAHHLQCGRAAHQGRFFQRWVHRLERGAHQEKCDRRVLNPVDPDHSGKRVNVEKHPPGPQCLLQQQIENADSRARQHDP